MTTDHAGETTDAYAAGFCIAQGHMPATVYALAQRPSRWGQAHTPVVFVFTGEGRDALWTYFNGDDSAVMISARRFKQGTDHAFTLARQARQDAGWTRNEERILSHGEDPTH